MEAQEIHSVVTHVAEFLLEPHKYDVQLVGELCLLFMQYLIDECGS